MLRTSAKPRADQSVPFSQRALAKGIASTSAAVVPPITPRAAAHVITVDRA
jgi:hypothetical protein